MGFEWSPTDRPTVGVVGTDQSAAENEVDGKSRPELLESLKAYCGEDASVVSGSIETVREASPSFVIAFGDESLTAIANTDAFVREESSPVVPVDCSPGIDAVSREVLPAVITAVLEGNAIERSRRLLSVTGESGSSRRALFDVTVDTEEPARISEYAVSSGSKSIGRFRADGVVVATPAGSHGYARAVNGPILSPEVDAVAVAPIAPYVTDPSRWVLPVERLEISIERNEIPVSVYGDGSRLETINTEGTLEISDGGTFPTLVVPNETDLE